MRKGVCEGQVLFYTPHSNQHESKKMGWSRYFDRMYVTLLRELSRRLGIDPSAFTLDNVQVEVGKVIRLHVAGVTHLRLLPGCYPWLTAAREIVVEEIRVAVAVLDNSCTVTVDRVGLHVHPDTGSVDAQTRRSSMVRGPPSPDSDIAAGRDIAVTLLSGVAGSAMDNSSVMIKSVVVTFAALPGAEVAAGDVTLRGSMCTVGSVSVTGGDGRRLLTSARSGEPGGGDILYNVADGFSLPRVEVNDVLALKDVLATAFAAGDDKSQAESGASAKGITPDAVTFEDDVYFDAHDDVGAGGSLAAAHASPSPRPTSRQTFPRVRCSALVLVAVVAARKKPAVTLRFESAKGLAFDPVLVSITCSDVLVSAIVEDDGEVFCARVGHVDYFFITSRLTMRTVAGSAAGGKVCVDADMLSVTIGRSVALRAHRLNVRSDVGVLVSSTDEATPTMFDVDEDGVYVVSDVFLDADRIMDLFRDPEVVRVAHALWGGGKAEPGAGSEPGVGGGGGIGPGVGVEPGVEPGGGVGAERGKSKPGEVIKVVKVRTPGVVCGVQIPGGVHGLRVGHEGLLTAYVSPTVTRVELGDVTVTKGKSMGVGEDLLAKVFSVSVSISAGDGKQGVDVDFARATRGNVAMWLTPETLALLTAASYSPSSPTVMEGGQGRPANVGAGTGPPGKKKSVVSPLVSVWDVVDTNMFAAGGTKEDAEEDEDAAKDSTVPVDPVDFVGPGNPANLGESFVVTDTEYFGTCTRKYGFECEYAPLGRECAVEEDPGVLRTTQGDACFKTQVCSVARTEVAIHCALSSRRESRVTAAVSAVVFVPCRHVEEDHGTWSWKDGLGVRIAVHGLSVIDEMGVSIVHVDGNDAQSFVVSGAARGEWDTAPKKAGMMTGPDVEAPPDTAGQVFVTMVASPGFRVSEPSVHACLFRSVTVAVKGEDPLYFWAEFFRKYAAASGSGPRPPSAHMKSFALESVAATVTWQGTFLNIERYQVVFPPVVECGKTLETIVDKLGLVYVSTLARRKGRLLQSLNPPLMPIKSMRTIYRFLRQHKHKRAAAESCRVLSRVCNCAATTLEALDGKEMYSDPGKNTPGQDPDCAPFPFQSQSQSIRTHPARPASSPVSPQGMSPLQLPPCALPPSCATHTAPIHRGSAEEAAPLGFVLLGGTDSDLDCVRGHGTSPALRPVTTAEEFGRAYATFATNVKAAVHPLTQATSARGVVNAVPSVIIRPLVGAAYAAKFIFRGIGHALQSRP
jgi:hypothetical protein